MMKKTIALRISVAELEELKRTSPGVSVSEIIRSKILKKDATTDAEPSSMTVSEIIAPIKETEQLRALSSIISKMIICRHCGARADPDTKCWWCGKYNLENEFIAKSSDTE